MAVLELMLVVLFSVAIVGAPIVVPWFFVYGPGKPESRLMRKTLRALPKEARGLSWPAANLVKMNNELPIGHRIPALVEVLRALDVKYGGNEAISNHYTRHRGYGSIQKNAWNHDRCGMSCRVMPEYNSIRSEIALLVKELENQRKAMEVSGVQYELDRVEDVLNHLRLERGLVKDVTKEITR